MTMNCKQFCMEFLGTLILVLSVALTGNPLAFAMIFMALVYVGGHVSGSHFNPAVTLAVAMMSPMSMTRIAGYMGSQILGGLGAGVIYYALTGSVFSPDTGMGIVGWKALSVEILFTYVFIMAILTATRSAGLKDHLYGLVIGFTFLGIAFMGGVYNPAAAVGPMAMDAMMTGASLFNLLIYVFGPLTGAALGAMSYKYFNRA